VLLRKLKELSKVLQKCRLIQMRAIVPG